MQLYWLAFIESPACAKYCCKLYILTDTILTTTQLAMASLFHQIECAINCKTHLDIKDVKCPF